MNLEKLVEEYKNGNEKSFDLLYEKTLPIVKAAIINYITDRETVLDLIQDTYLVFVEKKDSYQSKSFSNYIYTIAKNKALDYLKKKKELLLDDYDYIPDYNLSPCLNYLINKLEEPLREVFILKVLVLPTEVILAKLPCTEDSSYALIFANIFSSVSFHFL